MTKIGVIIGSTRPGRFGPQVGEWFFKRAQEKAGDVFELVDIADFNLPVLDEDTPGVAKKDHSRKWSEKIQSLDGFVFVTGEYNHSVPGNFKNAVDYLNSEWTYKPVGYVGYGWAKGHRSIGAWRSIAAQFHQYDLREEVNVQLDGTNTFKETDNDNFHADALIKAIVFWSGEFAESRKKLE